MVEQASALIGELTERIARHGSVRFDEFMELALYHRTAGFFGRGAGAGTARADFVTSPEVGPLFGAVMAKFLDARWQELGCPDPFVVIEAAAGRGALALAVRAAQPACSAALRYVLVERSESLRARQVEHLSLVHPDEVLGTIAEDAVAGAGPLFYSLAALPAGPVVGLVIANELLDNLPIRLLQRGLNEWYESRVTLVGDEFVELLVPADATTACTVEELLPHAMSGVWIPLQSQAANWLYEARSVLLAGSVLVIDYCSQSKQISERPREEWLRTYRSQQRGQHPLKFPGSQDITCEVAIDQVERVASVTLSLTQAEWLTKWGIADLVDEGRKIWSDSATEGSLAAVRGRSRIVEAEALLDPAGLGAFNVLEWRIN